MSAIAIPSPLYASVYFYMKIYFRLKSLGESRVQGHEATRNEGAGVRHAGIEGIGITDI